MFVAFDTGADCQSDGNVDSSVSQVDIRANNRVSSRSRIIRDDFRTLGTPNSVNHLQVSDYAPYDIVNLDFCDSILQPGLKGESMYRALLELFVLQRPAARGWGLILTSRVDSESVSASALEDLTLLVNNGLESANDRAAAFQGMFRSSTPFAFSEDEVTFRGSMSFALPFWISQIAAQEGLSVSVLPVIHYSVLESTSELEWGDLASFAFFFERSDDRSIAFPGDLEVVALDGRLNDRFDAVFSALSNAVQIDHRLAVRSSPEYLQACIEHSKALLRDAGWDVSGYDDWAYEQAMLFGLSSDI